MPEPNQDPMLDRSQLLDLVLDIFGVARFDGQLVDVNAAATAILGWSREELFAQSFFDLIHPDDFAEVAAHLAARRQDALVTEGLVVRMRHRDGSYRTLQWSGRVVGDYIYSVGRDITEAERVRAALAAAEHTYETWFLTHPLAMYVLAVGSWQVLAANQAALDQYGYSWSEMNGLSVWELLAPAEHERHRPLFAAVERGERPAGVSRGEMQHRRRDGSPLLVEATWNPINFRDQPAVLVLAIDIGSRRQAENELVAGRERLLAFARATADALWEWELETDRVWWSETFAQLFGYEPREVGENIQFWYEHIHPSDAAAVMESVRAAIEGGSGATWQAEYRLRRGDGSYAWVLDRGFVLHDEAGRAVRMVGGMTDLSERRRFEERLAEQAALLDQASDAIFVRRLSGEVTYWNASAERMFGFSREEVLGRLSRDLLNTDIVAWRLAQDTLLAEGEWAGEMVQQAKDGGKLTVAARWTLMRDEAGNPTQVLAFNTDITEKKQLEAQFLRAQRLESLGTLAGGIAHDLNNVLAPILMSVTVLRERISDERSLRLLDSLQQTAERGASIVRQVLAFARGMEGSPVLLDPRNVVQDVANIVRETFPRDVRLHTEAPRELWSINADPTQIHQVLVNLCVNARDAMPDGGELTLEAENVMVDAETAAQQLGAKPGPYVVLKVTDTGTGIPEEIRERIFEPFFTTKPQGKGTGLGLATVLAIVEGHHGFLDLYSQPNRGTCFKVYLPAEAEQSAGPSDAAGDSPRGRGELLLLVDDEAAVLTVAGQTLEAFGYRVVTAANGAEAVARYAERVREFALVITDVMMPVLDGAATIAALRVLNPQCRVIAASGLTEGPAMARAREHQVEAVLAKPFTANALLRAVRDVLDRH
jgi:PAS domain S-box-containing protein